VVATQFGGTGNRTQAGTEFESISRYTTT